MAITLELIEQHLNSLNIKYERKQDLLVTGFPTQNFVNPTGTKGVMLLIMLANGGQLFRVMAPQAMSASGLYADVVLRACTMLQYEGTHSSGLRCVTTMPASGKCARRWSSAQRCAGVLRSQRSPGRCQSSRRSRSAYSA